VLSYLHSTDTVHGDVRPTNILLGDERCSSIKLAGLGMSRLAAPKLGGTVALAYVDPRYLPTGELTPQCDVHALGVLLLRLVTGKPASAAKKAAREAATGGGRAWHEVVDASAGGWPMERATEVALLGLRCCDDDGAPARGRSPGEMLEEARGVLEAATSAAPGRTWSSLSSSSAAASDGGAPSYFLCPILKVFPRIRSLARRLVVSMHGRDARTDGCFAFCRR
jgi:serine/threonine protein kinase